MFNSKKINKFLIASILFAFAAVSLPIGTVSAATRCNDGTPIPQTATGDARDAFCAGSRGGVSSTDNFQGDCVTGEGESLSKENCGIVAYLVVFINILSAIVGIVVTIMIVWGGIQYSSSRDNPQQTQEAKTRIRNAIFALVFYLFIFAFLQWLVPGGVL
jgi:hypothetical protein